MFLFESLHRISPLKNSIILLPAKFLLLLSFLVIGSVSIARESSSDVTGRLKRLSSTVVTLTLDEADRGKRFRIESDQEISVFVNGQLRAAGRANYDLKTDSLFGRHSIPVLMAFVSSSAGEFELKFITEIEEGAFFSELRPDNKKVEFSVISLMVLLSLLLVLMKSNLRIFVQYFDFLRAFTWYRKEDPLSETRVTSTFNLTVYIFSILFVSLTATFVALRSEEDFSSLMIRWLVWSGAGAGFLLLRMVLIGRLSAVYGLEDLAGIQFFNAVRAGLFLGLFSLILWLIFFMMGSTGADAAELIRWVWFGVLALYYVLLLVRWWSFPLSHALHLFSYLCISEIIPLIALVRML